MMSVDHLLHQFMSQGLCNGEQHCLVKHVSAVSIYIFNVHGIIEAAVGVWKAIAIHI